MNVKLVVAIISQLLLALKADAQSPCSECLQAVEQELNSCLANAISVDDRNDCEERRVRDMKACEDRECRVERESKEAPTNQPPAR